MPKLMTKQQLVDENVALRHNAEQQALRIAHLEEELRVERALHAVQSAKLAHHGAKTVLRTAYQEACLKARELAKRTGKVVRVGD